MSDEAPPAFMRPPSSAEAKAVWLIERRPAGSTDADWRVALPGYAAEKESFARRAAAADQERMPDFEFRARLYGPLDEVRIVGSPP